MVNTDLVHRITKESYSDFATENEFKGFKDHINAMKFQIEEQKKQAEEAEAKRLANLAPDKDKIKAYLQAIGDIAVPEIEFGEATSILNTIIKAKLEMIEWGLKELEKLS